MSALPMLLLTLSSLLTGVAHADECADSLDDYVEEVRLKGREDAYRCLAERADAASHLVAWIDAASDDEKGRERVQRALAIHLVQRLDGALDGAQLHALGAPDLRLLRDAVYARRGRKSPSDDHDRVFRKFDWYEPDPGFTNGRLTEGDRANLALIDDPPNPAKPEPAEEAGPEPAAAALPQHDVPAPSEQVETWCGCGYGGSAGGAGLVWLAALGLAVRRRGQARG